MEAEVTQRDPVAGLPKPLRWLVAAERFASVALLLAVLGLMAAQVVARYVFGSPIPWSEELARFGLIWLAFIASVCVMAEGRHIAVDLISKFLDWRGVLVLESVVSLVILAVCGAFLSAGIQFLPQMGAVKSPALHIPMSWWYCAAVVAFGLIALHAIVNLVVAFQRKTPLWRETGNLPIEIEPGGGS
jgi:TRAP-type transport system small permease protein